MIRDDFVPSRVGATVLGRPQRRNCGMMFDNIYGGHPAPAGPALTNDLCGQNVKVKTTLFLTLTF